VEVSALQHPGVAGRHGRSPLLRLQTDERLIQLTRRGNHHAFEALVARYQPRLLSFCRHMLGSKEDAEDVLQEVFAAAFNAILSDDREINVRPWLYRIARNRSLNHLRRAQPIGVDSMDVHFSEQGTSTADKVHKREDFRLLIQDVQGLPETQRTALLLREIDALSYEQISEAMETTVPSVKSLLVRARVSLAEAAEARQMSCDAVRLELGEVAEGLRRMSPPVRRHVKMCDRCGVFRKQLRDTNKALAAVFPIGPLVLFKKFAIVHLGIGASGSATAASGVAGGAAAGSAVGAGAASGGLLASSAATLATKAAAGLAAAALVTAGAVEVHNAASERQAGRDVAAATPKATPAPAPTFTTALTGRRSAPLTTTRVVSPPVREPKKKATEDKPALKPANEKAPATTTTPAPAPDPTATTPTTTTPAPAPVTPAAPAPAKTQTSGDTTTLPPDVTTTTSPAPPPADAVPPAPPPSPAPTTQTVPPDVPLNDPSSPPAGQSGGSPPPDDGGSPPADRPEPSS
jgi:RNA polymerase sigma factor (sigma-70 family)